MPHDPNCQFCKSIANPETTWGQEVVWRFPHSIAILGPWQYYTGYCLLVSREHASELSQLGPNRSAFLQEMALLAEAIEDCFQPHKLNYELLGNLVPHLHWHIFPRATDDPNRLRPVWLELEKADKDDNEKLRLRTGKIPRLESVVRLQTWFRKVQAIADNPGV